MNRLAFWSASIVVAWAGMARGAADAPAAALPPSPGWQPPEPAAVRAELEQWLASQPLDDAARAQALAPWDAVGAPSPSALLERAVQTLAAADPRVAGLVASTAQPPMGSPLPDRSWLLAADAPAVLADVRLWYGRWLVQQSLADEAGELLAGLTPEEVADPASLLFYRAVVAYGLLDRDAGLADIDRLLSGASHAPLRYATVARLMQKDLDDLRDDSLDHIARRMDDIRRRLDLGRATPKVQSIEKGVVESLDKMIQELEEQQQQQAAGNAASLQSSSPAQDSTILGGKGPGEVTKRALGSESGWGDLPPKDREEALQQIGRDFPAHYRELIEQYFRNLADEEKQP